MLCKSERDAAATEMDAGGFGREGRVGIDRDVWKKRRRLRGFCREKCKEPGEGWERKHVGWPMADSTRPSVPTCVLWPVGVCPRT